MGSIHFTTLFPQRLGEIGPPPGVMPDTVEWGRQWFLADREKLPPKGEPVNLVMQTRRPDAVLACDILAARNGVVWGIGVVRDVHLLRAEGSAHVLRGRHLLAVYHDVVRTTPLAEESDDLVGGYDLASLREAAEAVELHRLLSSALRQSPDVRDGSGVFKRLGDNTPPAGMTADDLLDSLRGTLSERYAYFGREYGVFHRLLWLQSLVTRAHATRSQLDAVETLRVQVLQDPSVHPILGLWLSAWQAALLGPPRWAL